MMKRFFGVALLLLALAAPALAQLNAVTTYIGNTAGSNTLVGTVPGVASLNDLVGVPVRLLPSNANTGAVTLNINGLGATAVHKLSRGGHVPLTGGELQAAQIAEVIFDTAEYVCTTCATTYKLPTYTLLTSGTAATYTTPVGATRLFVKEIGGGGGGAAIGVNGSIGTTTTFGSTTALPGNPGTSAGVQGAGGSGGTTGTGTTVQRIAGGAGGSPTSTTTVGGVQTMPGGAGCVSPFGGGSPGTLGSSGIAGAANTGGGGAGAFNQASGGSGTFASLPGGGCGEYVEFVINGPAATYTYTIGPGGAAGGAAASAGSAGRVLVEEDYN